MCCKRPMKVNVSCCSKSNSAFILLFHRHISLSHNTNFPSNLATATNRRSRQTQQDLKTTRRRGSTLTATRTFRRGSQYQEIQVAALPDLSENLINESQTWEEIREIKALPVPMAQKRELKNQLQVSVKCLNVENEFSSVKSSHKTRFSVSLASEKNTR
jgi:hypothetical protein